MARIGFFSMPWRGHLNPMLALAGELQLRGHSTQFFHLPACEKLIREQGQEFRAYGPPHWDPLEDPSGDLDPLDQRLEGKAGEPRGNPSGDPSSSRGAGLEGEKAIAAALRQTRALARVCLAEAGPVIQKAGLDLWVIDQLDYASACLAAALRAPFVTVAVTLLKNEEPDVPGFSGEEPERSASLRLSQLIQPYRDQLTEFRLSHGLGPFDYETLWSSLAQISQQPVQFEFPRKHLPKHFHFTGPFVRPQQRPAVDFPWHKLGSCPMIYVCFGTALRPDSQLLTLLVEACRPLPVQVVVSLGGRETQPLPASDDQAMVVPYAPQWELLQRAEVAIHHAGLNTTLECLSAGVPMLVLPRAHDQPGVAARIEWTGCGLWHRKGSLEVGLLRESLGKLLAESSFRQRAQEFKSIIKETQGLAKAADLIEQVIQTKQPALQPP